MIMTAKKNGKILMIGHIERFNPAVIKLKEIIDNELLGKSLMLSIRRVGPNVPRIMDVGIIIDLATHDIDINRYLLGKDPESVYSRYSRIKHLQEDYASINLDFGGIFSHIEVNWFTSHKERTLVATGTAGSAYLDYIKQDITIHNGEWTLKPKITNSEPLKLELNHFIDCIMKGKDPQITGEDGMKTLEIALDSLMNE